MPKTRKASSSVLIDASMRGAWRVLEEKLRPFFARRLQRHIDDPDIDDLLQEVFLRIYRAEHQLHDDEKFGPWVYRIAHSVLIDFIRAQSTHTQIPEAEEEPESAVTTSTTPDDDREVSQAVAMQMRLFVELLPPHYRQAVLLSEIEGKTQKEVAELLGISLSGAKSRVQRGRSMLRAMFEECCRVTLDGRNKVIGCTPNGTHQFCDEKNLHTAMDQKKQSADPYTACCTATSRPA